MIKINENLIKDFNLLNDIYNDTHDENKRVDIYRQMLGLCYLGKKQLSRNMKKIRVPINYRKIRSEEHSEEEKKIYNYFLNINDLTYELSYYLRDSVAYLKSTKFSGILNKPITLGEYKSEILSFIENNMPEDLDLVKKIIANGQIILNMGFLTEAAYISYLEDLNKFYIHITYLNGLKLKDVRNTIHEIGHASTFMNTGKYKGKDFLLTEAISDTYEFLYLNSKIDMNKAKMEAEYGYMLKRMGIGRLYAFLSSEITDFNSYSPYLDNIKYLYGLIIALTITLNFDKKETEEILTILKNNYSSMEGFKLLDSVGIKDSDLIDTSKNLKKLILSR